MIETVQLDDALVEKAKEYSKISDISVLVHEALKALIHREASHRLAAAGGKEPNLKPIKRLRASG